MEEEQKPTPNQLKSLVDKFDSSLEDGNLPTIEEFKRVCKNRAELIRCNLPSSGGWGKESLDKEIERLEKAAAGDKNELITEALEHSNNYKFMKENRPPNTRGLRSKESEEQAIRELTSAEDTWKRLAELAGEI